QLCAFQRVAIGPGETKTVRLSVPPSRLAYWDVEQKAWIVEKDRIQLLVGASSTDIKLTAEAAVVE
ncbi:MAG TPA: fibronectin type III-like domain-contianing protein, partial [Pirellulales bacterium]